MHGRSGGARALVAGSTIRRMSTVIVLSGLAVLTAAVPSWASGAGADAAAVPGPELLGMPLLTLLWALSGLLAVAVGLLIASRSVTRRAVAPTGDQPAGRADPAPDRR